MHIVPETQMPLAHHHRNVPSGSSRGGRHSHSPFQRRHSSPHSRQASRGGPLGTTAAPPTATKTSSSINTWLPSLDFTTLTKGWSMPTALAGIGRGQGDNIVPKKLTSIWETITGRRTEGGDGAEGAQSHGDETVGVPVHSVGGPTTNPMAHQTNDIAPQYAHSFPVCVGTGGGIPGQRQDSMSIASQP